MKEKGWIEWQELHPWPQCDDGTMANDDILKRLYEHVWRAFSTLGMNLHWASEVGMHLETAKFENIHCVARKVPVGT